jgi:hypothetical protein
LRDRCESRDLFSFGLREKETAVHRRDPIENLALSMRIMIEMMRRWMFETGRGVGDDRRAQSDSEPAAAEASSWSAGESAAGSVDEAARRLAAFLAEASEGLEGDPRPAPEPKAPASESVRPLRDGRSLDRRPEDPAADRPAGPVPSPPPGASSPSTGLQPRADVTAATALFSWTGLQPLEDGTAAPRADVTAAAEPFPLTEFPPSASWYEALILPPEKWRSGAWRVVRWLEEQTGLSFEAVDG